MHEDRGNVGGCSEYSEGCGQNLHFGGGRDMKDHGGSVGTDKGVFPVSVESGVGRG